VTVEQAQSALDAVSARLEAAFPETNEGWYATLLPLRDVLVGDVRPALVVLLAAVGLVLLIACANVVNLLLARAAAPRGEIAVRSAMGATRFRLARQMVTESVLLALLGGAAGVAFAWVGVEALRVLQPGNLPRLDEIGFDATTFGFCALLSLGVGLMFGMVPAVGLRGNALKDALSTAGRGMSGGGRRLRGALVAGEVALSFVLLVGAGLLLRSFLTLRAVDPGFDAVGAVVVPVSLPERAWPEGEALEAARDAIRDRLSAIQGVAAVGAASIIPLSGSGGDTYVHAETRPPANLQNVENTAQIRFVDEGWFNAMGIPIVSGRAFERSDDRDAPIRVILNERLARDLFPDEDPLGKRMVVWLDELRPLEIIGVAADVRQFSLDIPAQREFYLSARQRDVRALNFVVRGPGAVPPPAPALRDAVRRADPGQPVSRIVPLESYVDVTVATDRFQALLVLLFAVLAVSLSAIGIYGVLAHAVGQRRREIGIRMAMGAGRSTVARMIVREGLGVALIGASIGLAGAIATARALGSLLFGIGPVDPLTWVATPVFLLAVVLLSSWLPALQAARTEPATVLRDDL
jgi:predicted permease